MIYIQHNGKCRLLPSTPMFHLFVKVFTITKSFRFSWNTANEDYCSKHNYH